MDGSQSVAFQRHRYTQKEIIHRIRAFIERGEYQVGERIGSERSLADYFDISRFDLRTALASMEANHEVRRKIGRGGGIVVADARLERNINTIESLPVIAKRQGFVISSRVLCATMSSASSADTRLLKLRGDQVTISEIKRLRFIEDKPLSLEINRMPSSIFPQLLTHDLGESLYTIFERDYGVRPAHVDEILESALASPQEATLLGVQENTPLIRLRRLSSDESGRVFERATDVYIASRMRFTMHHSGYVRLSATSAAR